MYWIEGIGRNAEGFVLETVASTKGRTTQPLKNLAEMQELGRAQRCRLTTDCASWSRETGAAFWKQLGVARSRPKDGHTVFRFTDDGKDYLVPASVFIAAVMRPIQHIQHYLFKPQGLELFSTPICESALPTVGLLLSPSKIFGYQNQPSNGLLANYSWLHCFPSAYGMWSSVYLAACQGKLDVALPKARLTLTLHSVKAGDYRLVTKMLVTKLDTLEDPYPFAAHHTPHILMHESSELDWQELHRPQSFIPPHSDQTWHLSDYEWQAIEPLFAGREQTKYALRDILDLILVKLGTGRAWQKLDYGLLNFSIVQATYQRLTKRGTWQTIAGMLMALRSPVPSAN